MSATAAQIAQVRRMIAEPTTDTYTDDDIMSAIEQYPCADERGEDPYTWNTATKPASQVENDSWVPTYDLHAAAADLWEEKAALAAQDYDFNADGGAYNRAQVFDAYMKAARYHQSRRKVGTVRAVMHPKPDEAATLSWVLNAAEE